VSTAVVARTDLATTIQAAGTLGYAGSYELVNQAAGRFITALPAAGRVLARGEIVYEVDGTAIPLFYGPRPMWRDLGAGVTPGPDVAQLDDNLIALGFDDGGRLTASDQFTAFTGAAVRAWQRARGIAATGSAESAYYDWVDQYDAVGLGYNVPYVTGNESDAIEALVNGKWVVMRIPYPLGFFAKSIDGRIDDPRAGWARQHRTNLRGCDEPRRRSRRRRRVDKVDDRRARGNNLFVRNAHRQNDSTDCGSS